MLNIDKMKYKIILFNLNFIFSFEARVLIYPIKIITPPKNTKINKYIIQEEVKNEIENDTVKVILIKIKLSIIGWLKFQIITLEINDITKNIILKM